MTSAQAGLLISEFMASNSRYAPDPQGQFEDWIEIANDSNDVVDLAGMYLTDDLEDLTKWQFPLHDPQATTLEPQAYLLLWADGDVEEIGLHASFKLSADGEELALVDVDGVTILDSVVFDEQYADITYGRDPLADNTWRFLAWPTPGKANMPGYRGTVDAPVFSHERGFYEAPFSLTLTCDTPDARIVYTTDGADPVKEGGTSYTDPILIRKTACIRAAAIKPGYVPSPIISHTFLYQASAAIKSLPIISLVGSPEQTFYEPDGVMAIVGGTYSGGVWTSTGPDSYNNVLEHGLERPVSFEYLKAEDNTSLQVDCGIRVHGSNWMRPRYTRGGGVWSGNNKFSFRLYFRGEYGASWLAYPMFPFAVDRFKSIVLRGGHNDRTNPFIKDELTRRLQKDMGHVSSGGSFANLFINGEYKGYFNPCEHITETFCQSWFDSQLDWDIITMGSGIREGDRNRINALTQFIRTHDLSIPDYYDVVARQVDIDQFVDYLILRLWAGDWDWPHNNWSAASERSNAGRWNFFVWDGEGGMFSNRLQTVFFENMHSNSNENALIYHGLHANPRFRLHFGDRVEKHFGPGGVLTAEHITPRFREMQDELRGVIPNMDTYVLSTWIPQRRDIFLNACRQEGVYTFTGPRAYRNTAEQLGGYFQPGDLLSLIPTTSGGTVYYTTDGTDPADYGALGQQQWTTLVHRGAAKRALVPTGNLGRTWTNVEYNDSAWLAASGNPGGVGYERGSGYQDHISLDLGSAMADNPTCLIRIPFTYDTKTGVDAEILTLGVQYDDGFIAYLNGVEVARRNFTGSAEWNSTASSQNDDSAAVTFAAVDISSSLHRLRNGDNLLAFHGLNISTGSSDFLINAELHLGRSEPVPLPTELTAFETPLTLTESTQIKARTLYNNTWSSLTEGTYALSTASESLRITELMYHPLDTGDPNDPNLEYIELKNTADIPLNLALLRFTEGIYFTFPSMNINPGDLILVVRHQEAFETRYGLDLPVVGQYEGNLNNGGEWVELRDAADQIVQRFRFRDNWYEDTDGDGFALTVIDPAQTDPESLSDPNLWQPGRVLGGSPGWEE
jgi:hypothetical protein